MPVIGVDVSGRVGADPPIYVAAVKLGRRVQQSHRIIYLSPTKHDEYVACTRNWCEKLSAILVFMASVNLYTSRDVIAIDNDWEGRRRAYVKCCLERLFGKRFFGQHPLNEPNIIFVPARLNENVKRADVKSRAARHKRIEPDLRDPNLSKELDWLEAL